MAKKTTKRTEEKPLGIFRTVTKDDKKSIHPEDNSWWWTLTLALFLFIFGLIWLYKTFII